MYLLNAAFRFCYWVQARFQYSESYVGVRAPRDVSEGVPGRRRKARLSRWSAVMLLGSRS